MEMVLIRSAISGYISETSSRIWTPLPRVYAVNSIDVNKGSDKTTAVLRQYARWKIESTEGSYSFISSHDSSLQHHGDIRHQVRNANVIHRTKTVQEICIM